MRRVALLFIALILLFAGAPAAVPAHAAVIVSVTPRTLRPGGLKRIEVRVRNLPAGVQTTVAVTPPAPSMDILASATSISSSRGAVDLTVTFPADEAGIYFVAVNWPRGGYVSVPLRIVWPARRNCAAGPIRLAHVFSRGPEVLVQGKSVRAGQSVWVLGLGYPPCSPVSFAVGPPNANFSVVRTGVSTDRNGTFKAKLHIPTNWQSDAMVAYPRVNGVTSPVFTIAVVRGG